MRSLSIGRWMARLRRLVSCQFIQLSCALAPSALFAVKQRDMILHKVYSGDRVTHALNTHFHPGQVGFVIRNGRKMAIIKTWEDVPRMLLTRTLVMPESGPAFNAGVC